MNVAVPLEGTSTVEPVTCPISDGPYLGPNDVIDTPIKRDSSTMLPFTTLTRCRLETINAMGKEMKGYFVGPMPAGDFLQEFLPTSQIPDYDPSSFTSAFAVGAFNRTVSVRNEEHAYTPFINAIKPFAPQLSFVDTHKYEDTKNCSKLNSKVFNIKPDVCVYPDGCEPSSPNCDVSTTEIIIEFKWSPSHDAFRQPGADSLVSQTEKGMDTLGQITSYTAAQLGTQFRTHVFSVLIVRDRARIIRWDREGAIVTSPIDYNNEPHLADFFYRYARASPEMRGVDTSVTLAGDEEADLARSRLNIPSTTRMFKVDVPHVEGSGSVTLVFPQPVMKPHSPVGRWTRACPAFDLVNKKLVMLKDSWRVSLPDVLPEGETYKLLMSKKVAHIPKCIAYHDVPPSIAQQSTQTAKFGSAEWALPHLPLTPHTHHRLALDIVGKNLTEFESSHQLVSSVRDALIAHKDAFELAKVLHRDLSVGNVVIYKGKGYLIDWDLAKLGTWQFMSAYLVEHKYAIHSVKDDLESSFYVVLWTTLKYKETYMDIVRRTSLITQVFETNPGSSSKADWLIGRSNLPNLILIHALAEFFSHRYTRVTEHQQTVYNKFRLAHEKATRNVPVVQDLLAASYALMTDSPVYQKEIDSAVLQKLKSEEKYEPVLVTKSQSLFASGVEITVSGKRRRLDNADDDGDDLSSIADLDALTSLT
ncbi:hypothetical protein DFJ58DRAFT_848314 [Suillus subalutaceus]|uniref:uncharacterized protein n=1 Tax=Suillus subalutaceus TaxID=48586 RepID=UPI001B864FEF|nr:uncharacterized protein DFJ58DRAFT_848314 [Suillus subalutaceus]KAG1831161.1 hypothetical protein DFJ58DRAFT_848314 [Suillus subalutaceus]